MRKLNGISYLYRARNAEHYRLQEALLRAITAEFSTKYQLAALREAYSKAFENEDSIYLQTRSFTDTKALNAKDAERDRLFRLVSLTIQNKELSLDATEAETGATLAYVLKPYKGAASKADAENTAMVSDFVKKLQSDDYSSEVEALGLTAAVAALKTANDEFDVIYSHRANEKRVRALAEKIRKARRKVDVAFAKLADAINALYAANKLVEKDATKEAEIGAVIDAANAEILQFAETLSRRGVGKKSTSAADDAPVTDGGTTEGDTSEEDTSGGSTTGDVPELM